MKDAIEITAINEQGVISAADVPWSEFTIFNDPKVKKRKYQISSHEYRITTKNDIQKLRFQIAKKHFPGHTFNKDVWFKIIFPEE